MQKTVKAKKGGRKPAFTVAPNIQGLDFNITDVEVPEELLHGDLAFPPIPTVEAPQTIRLNIGPKATEAEKAAIKAAVEKAEREEAQTHNVLHDVDFSARESIEAALRKLPENNRNQLQQAFDTLPLEHFQLMIAGYMEEPVPRRENKTARPPVSTFYDYYRKWSLRYEPEKASEAIGNRAFVSSLPFKIKQVYNQRAKKFEDSDPETEVRLALAKRIETGSESDRELYSKIVQSYTYFPALKALMKGYMFAVAEKPMLTLSEYEREFHESAEYTLLRKREAARSEIVMAAITTPQTTQAYRAPSVPARITGILSQPVTKAELGVASEELYNDIVRVAGRENQTYTEYDRPTDFANTVVNTLYARLQEREPGPRADGEISAPPTVGQFAEALSGVAVYLRASLMSVSNNVFRNRIKSGYYRPEVLATLSDAQKLPEIFDNPAIHPRTKAEVAKQIRKLRNKFVREFAENIYSFRNKFAHIRMVPALEGPIVVSAELLKPSCANYDIELMSGPFAGFRVAQTKAEDLVVYEENGLNYCFDGKQLAKYLENSRYAKTVSVNPYTEQPFAESFVKGIKSSLQQKLVGGEAYQTSTVTYTDNDQTYYFNINDIWERFSAGDTTNPVTGEPLRDDWVKEFRDIYNRPVPAAKPVEVEPRGPLAPGLLDLIRNNIAGLAAIKPRWAVVPEPAALAVEKAMRTDLRPGLTGSSFFTVLYQGLMRGGRDNPELLEDFCEYLKGSLQTTQTDPCESEEALEEMLRTVVAVYTPAQVSTDIISPILEGVSVAKIVSDNPGHAVAIRGFAESGLVETPEAQEALIAAITESVSCVNCATVGEIELGVLKLIFDSYHMRISSEELARIQPGTVNVESLLKTDEVNVLVRFKVYKLQPAPAQFETARREYELNPEKKQVLEKEVANQFERDRGLLELIQYDERIQNTNYYKPPDIKVNMIYNPDTQEYITQTEFEAYIKAAEVLKDGCGEGCGGTEPSMDGCGLKVADGCGDMDLPMPSMDGCGEGCGLKVADGCGLMEPLKADGAGNSDSETDSDSESEPEQEMVDSNLNKQEIVDTLAQIEKQEEEETEREIDIEPGSKGVLFPSEIVCETCGKGAADASLKTIIIKNRKPTAVYFCCFSCFEKYQ